MFVFSQLVKKYVIAINMQISELPTPRLKVFLMVTALPILKKVTRDSLCFLFERASVLNKQMIPGRV